MKREYSRPRVRHRNERHRSASSTPHRSGQDRRRTTKVESSRNNSDCRSQREYYPTTRVDVYREAQNKPRTNSQSDNIGPPNPTPVITSSGHEINQSQYMHALNKEIESIRHGENCSRRSSEGTSKRYNDLRSYL